MIPTSHLLKSTSSSTRWLARQSSDPYVRARLSGSGPNTSSSNDADSQVGGAYRSRASYKLLEIWKRFPGLMRKGGRVVDLGAAPGGWSQVALQAVTPKGLVIGLDLLPITPLEGITFIQGDFLSQPVQAELAAVLAARAAEGAKGTEKRKPAWWSTRGKDEEGFGLKDGAIVDGEEAPPIHDQAKAETKSKLLKIDTVLSDMMCNISGIRDRDVAGSLELCEAGLEFARIHLKVAKRREEVVVEDEGEEGDVTKAQVENFDRMMDIVRTQEKLESGRGGKKRSEEKRGRLDDGLLGGGWLVTARSRAILLLTPVRLYKVSNTFNTQTSLPFKNNVSTQSFEALKSRNRKVQDQKAARRFSFVRGIKVDEE